jgi:hypothetical protein
MRAFLVLSGASNTDAVLPKFTDCSNSILRQVMTKEGAAKITKALWHHQMMPKSVVFLAPTQVGGINGHIEAIKSTANWMEVEMGERQSHEEAASEFGMAGRIGAVKSTANRMEAETGERPTLACQAT